MIMNIKVHFQRTNAKYKFACVASGKEYKNFYHIIFSLTNTDQESKETSRMIYASDLWPKVCS